MDLTNNFTNNIRTKKGLDKVLYILRYLYSGLKKMFNKLIRVKYFIRGYSTLQQQIVRRTIMYPYSYNYLFRRKIFIENVYIRYFIKAYRIRIIKDKKVKRRWLNYLRSKKHVEDFKSEQRKLIDYEIKIKMLMYYYIEILGEPKNPEELLDKICTESAHSKDALLSKRKTYNMSNFKNNIVDEITGQIH